MLLGIGSPLNKVFTALHRSTQVCILGTISEYKDKKFYSLSSMCNDFFNELYIKVSA